MVGSTGSMVLLRKFELAAQVACRKGETPGFLHLYIGEEATAVGVCAHLRPTDWITSTHRGHGHALAKGMDPRVLMAELYGKHDGCCGGRGGTMHLYDSGDRPVRHERPGRRRHSLGGRCGDQREVSRHATGSRSPSSATGRPTTRPFTNR